MAQRGTLPSSEGTQEPLGPAGSLVRDPCLLSNVTVTGSRGRTSFVEEGGFTGGRADAYRAWGERPVWVGMQTLRCEGCSSGDDPQQTFDLSAAGK
jgi:hypothetical protein